MSQISYFQRYSQRENHATNNSLLMLKHIYERSPNLFERVLAELIADENTVPTIGPVFAQQERVGAQIPDGSIVQTGFRFLIEAKGPGIAPDEQQLVRHLDALGSAKDMKFETKLLALTSETILRKSDDPRLIRATFDDLLSAIESTCSGERQLAPIIEDYRGFLGEEGLLPTKRWTMVAVPCGDTAQENVKLRVYYHPATKVAYEDRASFMGIYRDKCITHIARLSRAVVCRIHDDNTLEVVDPQEGILSDDEHSRIEKAVILGTQHYGSFAREPRRFYLFDEIEICDFRKVSAYGMPGHRYFDLKDYTSLGKMPHDDLPAIAAQLREATWT